MLIVKAKVIEVVIDDIRNIIKYESEGALVDFKRAEYPLGKDPKKNELLKDISAMANHPSNDTKVIIIGVIEKNGLACDFLNIENSTDQALYQQFIDENIEPRLNFEYKTFSYEGYNLAVFIISKNNSRPYLFKRNIHKISDHTVQYRIGDGFIRTGSSTKKLTRDDFESIYKNRFEKRDRTNDIKISPFLKKSSNWFDMYNLDFSIENLSSESIEFEIEFRVFYSNKVLVLKTYELEKILEGDSLPQIYPQYFSPTVDRTFPFIEISEGKDHFKVSRLNGLRLPQNYILENVFLSDVYLGCISNYLESKIEVELTLRSDEFKKGPFTKKYEFSLKI